MCILQQDAVAKAVGDAQQNIKTDQVLKSALTDLLHDKINSLNPYGEISLDNSHIEFNVHPSSTVNLFQFLPLSSAVALPSISLKRVRYIFETSNLVVATHDYGSQSIIPDSYIRASKYSLIIQCWPSELEHTSNHL